MASSSNRNPEDDQVVLTQAQYEYLKKMEDAQRNLQYKKDIKAFQGKVRKLATSMLQDNYPDEYEYYLRLADEKLDSLRPKR